MIAELIRMWAVALADPTLGVNAQIAALVMDTTVAGITDTRPPNIVKILNQADHNVEVHEGEGAAQYPLILVGTNSPFGGLAQTWNGVQDTSGDLHAVYVTHGGSAAQNFLATDYTLRAMKRATHAYLLATGRDTFRKRNTIGISTTNQVEIVHAEGDKYGGEVAGFLKWIFTARDLAP